MPEDPLEHRPSFVRSDATSQVDADLYRLLVEAAIDYAIYAIDLSGRILTWNDAAEAISGYTLDEVVGEQNSRFYTAEDVAAGKPERDLRTAAETGRFHEEGWRVRKGGSRFWADIVITALRDETGAVIGYGEVVRDSSERHATEEELRQSEERFRLLVSAVKDYAIFMLDPDGRIATWNIGAELIKGYTAEEVIGRSFAMFFPPEDVASGKPELELEIAAREGRFEKEAWRVRKDGTRFWANVVLTAIRKPNGRLIGFAKVTRDLTERLQAQQKAVDDARRLAAEEAARNAAETRATDLAALNERLKSQAEELEQRRIEAEHANRAKSEFLATMSHELRTPLNAIGGYVDLILAGIRGPVSETQVQDLERVRTSQRHLLTLINDLLNFARIEAGRVNYNFTDFDVGGLVSSVAGMIEPRAIQRGINFDLAVHGGVRAHADPDRVGQILLNLLSNAVKFTGPGGRIAVDFERKNNRVVIKVSDTGPGISPEQMEKIFEPFVQLDTGLTRSREGVGLGLAISRELARAMKGDLAASSKEGEGSTFTLVLPAA